MQRTEGRNRISDSSAVWLILTTLLKMPTLALFPLCCLPHHQLGLPRWLSGQEICLPSRRRMFDPWVRKIPWRRKWQHAPVFFPGKTHRQRSLAGYSPWGCKRVGHDLVTKQQNSNQLEFSAIHVHIYIHISRETFITNHVQAHFMNICSLILESFSEIHRVVLELGSTNSETPTHLFPANCSTFAF